MCGDVCSRWIFFSSPRQSFFSTSTQPNPTQLCLHRPLEPNEKQINSRTFPARPHPPRIEHTTSPTTSNIALSLLINLVTPPLGLMLGAQSTGLEHLLNSNKSIGEMAGALDAYLNQVWATHEDFKAFYKFLPTLNQHIFGYRYILHLSKHQKPPTPNPLEHHKHLSHPSSFKPRISEGNMKVQNNTQM